MEIIITIKIITYYLAYGAVCMVVGYAIGTAIAHSIDFVSNFLEGK